MIPAQRTARSRVGRDTSVAGISSVSGTISEGSAITITGSDFGAGCSTIRFENFSGFTSDGETLTTSNTDFDSVSAYPPISTTDSRSGTYSMVGFKVKPTDSDDYRGATATIDFGADYTELFLSYAIKNPTGKRWPGLNSTGPNMFEGGSNLKTAWLYSDSTADYQLDQILGSNFSDGFHVIGNNTLQVGDSIGTKPPGWWTFGEWNRMAYYMQCGSPDPNADTGTYHFEGMSETNGRVTESGTGIIQDVIIRAKTNGIVTGGPFIVGETVTGDSSGATGQFESIDGADSMRFDSVFGTINDDPPTYFTNGETMRGATSNATTVNDEDDGAGNGVRRPLPKAWHEVQIVGWARQLSLATYSWAGDVQILIDDIYVALGDNSAARVEIGDNSSYTSCTILSLCDYSAWSDSSISATIRGADLNLGADLWLFITKSDNSTQYSYKIV